MRRVNLIPMAGQGSRFLHAGYRTPKPLIEVDGLPMVVKSAKCLPDADRWIFICRKEHIAEFEIDKVLNKYFDKVTILTVDFLKEGQVSTCLIAKDYLNSDDFLTIGACDNGMSYDQNRFFNITQNSDVTIWTFRNHSVVLGDPTMYGWVQTSEEGQVLGVSCKTPISDNPISDHAVSGTFTFKKAKSFLDCAERVIKKNRRINNEFYLDTLIDECVTNGYEVSSLEIDKYYCWGTPKDLKSYLY